MSLLLKAAGKGKHTKSCLQCIEGSLIWSGRNQCHPLGIHHQQLAYLHTHLLSRMCPFFCSSEIELCSVAEHGQMLQGASTNQRNQSGAEPWDCGRNDAVLPLSLIFTLQCISPSIYTVFCLASISGQTNYGQKQELDYPPQSFADIIFLHLRNFTSSQAGNGKQVQQLCSLYCSSFSWFHPCCPAALPVQGDTGSQLCVCWLLSLCIPRTALPWAQFTSAFSGYLLTLHALRQSPGLPHRCLFLSLGS